MLRLFRTITLRHFRDEWGKLLLSVVGVMLGVAVFLAIRLANTTALGAFSSSLDAVAGRANLQVLSNDGLGFDESLIGRLREIRAVEAAAPVVEQYAQIVDSAERARPGSGTPVLVFGVDIFAENRFRSYTFPGGESGGGSEGESGGEGLKFLLEPDAIIITSKLARQYGLQRGDSLPMIAAGKRLLFRVSGIIEPTETASALGGNFALLDIASAQEIFNRKGLVDRVDLLVAEKGRAELKEYLQSLVPASVTVQEPASRGTQTLKMVEAFDLNLTALAFIALFVSMFIIYNTLLTTMLRRRRELGILRAIGATRGMIVTLFLGEALMIGVLGSIIGIPVGIMLARLALDQVTQTVTALYILTVTEHLVIDSTTLLLGAALGIVTSILSALPPAIEASRVHPRETFSVQALETRVARGHLKIMGGSIVLLGAAILAAIEGEVLNSPMLGFASAGLLLLGFALVTPGFIRIADRIFGRLIRRIFGVEGGLANAYLLQSIGRSSTAIAALTSAVAMLIGVSTMVDSFRRTVEYWMRQTITADLYMTVSSNRLSSGPQSALAPEIIRYVDSLPGVERVDALKRIRIGYAGRTVTVSGARLNMAAEDASLTFLEGDWADAMRALDAGGVIVSESFGRQFKKGTGDTVTISTPTGPQSLAVGGVYYDYTSDAGTMIMRKELFGRIFADTSTNNVALYLRNPSDLTTVREDIERRFGGRYSLLVYSNLTLREEVLKIFDQTFAITYALQLVAIIVAAIGVANTLAAMVVERSREIGIMKAIGGTAAQVRKMTLVQAGLIGVASQSLGIVAGILLSAILIYVINRVSFGWTIQMQLNPWVIFFSSLLLLATSFVAGLGPARSAARKPVAEVVRAE
jgi:putative ABC transport system permease protein